MVSPAVAASESRGAGAAEGGGEARGGGGTTQEWGAMFANPLLSDLWGGDMSGSHPSGSSLRIDGASADSELAPESGSGTWVIQQREPPPQHTVRASDLSRESESDPPSWRPATSRTRTARRALLPPDQTIWFWAG